MSGDTLADEKAMSWSFAMCSPCLLALLDMEYFAALGYFAENENSCNLISGCALEPSVW